MVYCRRHGDSFRYFLLKLVFLNCVKISGGFDWLLSGKTSLNQKGEKTLSLEGASA